MDPYLAGKDAQEGSPAHALYVWIESLHERMDLFVAQFTADGWEHDYSVGSLKFLEEESLPLYTPDDGTHATGLYMEALAGYLGEALLDEGGGRWIWDEEAGAVGLPAVQPAPALGLEPIVPILLVGQAVYERTENIFATVALRLRKAVAERKAAEPGWKPRRVPTPWVRHHELDECGALWKHWPNERLHDYLTWWADQAGGGRERWDFTPASLEAMEDLLRDRLGTVEEYDKVAGNSFWTVAAWYAGEYVVRRKKAGWQFRRSNPAAPPGTWHAVDSYWTDTIHVAQRLRYAGHAEHPTEMLRDVLRGERLADVVDRFADPAGEHTDEAWPDWPDKREPWPEILWPLVAPEHLPAPLTPAQRAQLAVEYGALAADPDLAGDAVSEHGSEAVSEAVSEDVSGWGKELFPKWGSHAVLTMWFPPFTEPTVPAPHDPVRARRFVEELGTVEEIIEQLPDIDIADVADPRVRADLDLVAVGCWGNMVHIVEPALGSDLLTEALTDETTRQRARHPEARIVGSVDIDYGNSYLQDVVLLPTGEELTAGGWDCDEDWEIFGDAEAVLRAIGVDRSTATEEGFDLDDEPSERDWPVLGTLALGGGLHPAADSRLKVSVFRVRRTPSARFDLEEVWLGR